MPTNPTIPPAGLDLGPGRRRVTRQDFVMYRALVGDEATTVERKAAATARSADDSARRPRKAWLPRVSKVLVLQAADCYQGIYLRLGQPEFPDWVRRVSRDARQKLHDAQARLLPSRAAPRG